ncbi:neutral/alkaline non-lysosomal ceramidase N-terminal domain-containing protein [Solimonas soli]|uniref:neutral/alkaline non-lysosomal ceramidase N-terminal domain-containing protein n=1 Tax=Solimonas soli TaxID=413479 RepID=UPI00146F954C|nr:neutral/alkaline non-lysosomal ceramidase N-terminal domain-containing protein [Solimonas soli]
MIAAAVGLAACGSSSPSVHQAGAVCEVGQLDETQMLALKRAAPDQPLADLSHYAPRRHARAADALLNGGGCESNRSFRYGAGVGDITGPALGEEQLGYADPAQVSQGIHTREHARAFAFSSQCGGRSGYAMLVNVDNALAFDSIKFGVMKKIADDTQDRLADYWTMDNVLISATHTHSSAGGQAHYDYVNLFALGFDQQAYGAVVDGIFQAIVQAHRNLMQATPGPIAIATRELLDTAVNRSPPAYAQDPEAERRAFVDTAGREVTTNRMMTLLKLKRDDGTPVGMINWYSVHGTSIGQTHKLLSGDNKGYAAQRFEHEFSRGVYADGAFVAGFFQSDEGDSSPNLFMMELPESVLHAHGGEGWDTRGGGRDDYESAMISGYKQYHHALALWDDADEKLHGEVKAIHIPIDMSKVVIEAPKTYPDALMPAVGAQRTCEPAFGVTFAAGAEDGRGPFSEEGAACPMSDDRLLPFITGYLQTTLGVLPDGALPSTLIEPVGCYNPAFALLGYACQQEKPILLPLAVAPAGLPLVLLQARTAPLQIVTLGNLAIISLPWEVTTMAGRRLREAVLDTLQDAGIDYAVIAGLSNSYVDYLTTREEYSVQNYEGGSNIYGPWSLDAVIQEMTRLASHLRDGSAAASPYADPRYRDHVPLLPFHLGLVVSDSRLPAGAAFGDVTQQPAAEYQMTRDERLTVSARFYSAHPRNDLMLGSSYLYVDRKVGDDWKVVATDDDWWTRFTYLKNGGGSDEALVEWQVPAGTEPGTYRIRYQGVTQDGTPYSGSTQPFALKGCS